MTATLLAPQTTEELIAIINEKYRATKQVAVVAGAYGDMEECEAIVESFVTPPEGGTFTKFYGCSFLFKGAPFKNIVEGISMSKSMISELPREIVARSFLLKIILALFVIFAPGRLIHYARIYVNAILAHSIRRFPFPRERYNTLTNEMRRALERAIDLELKRKGVTKIKLQESEPTKHEFYQLVLDIAEFVFLFIEHDNAYRMRLQDIMEEVDKLNVSRSIVREMSRLLDIAIERENPYNGIRHKWIQMKKLVIPALMLNKDLRRLVKAFFLELDIPKVSLDESDWYFCLKRRGYQFRGIPLEQRLKERERIDKERGHLFLSIRKVADPKK